MPDPKLVEAGKKCLADRAKAVVAQRATLHAHKVLSKNHPEEYNSLRHQYIEAHPPIPRNRDDEAYLARVGESYLRYRQRCNERARIRRLQRKENDRARRNM